MTRVPIFSKQSSPNLQLEDQPKTSFYAKGIELRKGQVSGHQFLGLNKSFQGDFVNESQLLCSSLWFHFYVGAA